MPCPASSPPLLVRSWSNPPPSVADLFDPLPTRWGLRGDPLLWEEIKDSLREMPCPPSADRLAILLSAVFAELTGRRIDEVRPIVVERYRSGGLSGRVVDPAFWREVAIPLLCSRLQGRRA